MGPRDGATMGPARGPARGDARRAPRRLRAAGRLVFSEEGPAALCGASPQSFRLAYCRVLSRAVTVDGKGCIGLVPFYDFLNHGRLGSEASVELLTYGQAVRRAGGDVGAEGSFLDLDDALLVATADGETGAELLTGCADAGADEERRRVKLRSSTGSACLRPNFIVDLPSRRRRADARREKPAIPPVPTKRGRNAIGACSGYCAAPRRASRGRAIFFSSSGRGRFSTASPPARPSSGASACAAASRRVALRSFVSPATASGGGGGGASAASGPPSERARPRRRRRRGGRGASRTRRHAAPTPPRPRARSPSTARPATCKSSNNCESWGPARRATRRRARACARLRPPRVVHVVHPSWSTATARCASKRGRRCSAESDPARPLPRKPAA